MRKKPALPRSTAPKISLSARSSLRKEGTVSRSDNVLKKATIVGDMEKIIQSKGLGQRAVAMLLGLRQPQVSMMFRGQFNAYSIEQLSSYLQILSNHEPRAKTAKTTVTKTAPVKALSIAPRQPVASDRLQGQGVNANHTSQWMIDAIEDLRRQLSYSHRSGRSQGISGEAGGEDESLAFQISSLRRENAILRERTKHLAALTALTQNGASF
jgi:predicted XRE-type DNA-binding protein